MAAVPSSNVIHPSMQVLIFLLVNIGADSTTIPPRTFQSSPCRALYISYHIFIRYDEL